MRLLDGVPIRTSRDGKFCARDCPLMTFDQGTICALERALVGREKVKSRYDEKADAYRRCPQCLRRERLSAMPTRHHRHLGVPRSKKR